MSRKVFEFDYIIKLVLEKKFRSVRFTKEWNCRPTVLGCGNESTVGYTQGYTHYASVSDELTYVHQAPFPFTGGPVPCQW